MLTMRCACMKLLRCSLRKGARRLLQGLTTKAGTVKCNSPTADVYAYVKTNAQQNLYQLQLPVERARPQYASSSPSLMPPRSSATPGHSSRPIDSVRIVTLPGIIHFTLHPP